MEDIIADTTEVPKIISDCYKWLYDNKFGNLEEMNKFLDIHLTNTES
jgi:hypothetical protein